MMAASSELVTPGDCLNRTFWPHDPAVCFLLEHDLRADALHFVARETRYLPLRVMLSFRAEPRVIRAATKMQIALFQPDIPQNTGTILRLCACLDVAAHIIEPAGFPTSDRAFRRAGMDYLDQVRLTRHDSWPKFEQWRRGLGHRLVLFTTRGAGSYLDYAYKPADILLFGRESIGVTDEVVAVADARLVIPLKPGLRSLNVAMAAAMAIGEALRQTRSAART